MTPRRVAITGMGLVTPFGVGVEEFWTSLVAGRSAVARLDLMGGDAPCHLAAPVPDFDVRAYVADRKLLRVMCRGDRFGLAAARMAVDQAGAPEVTPERRGAFVGTGKEMGPIEALFDAMRASRDTTGEMTAPLMGSAGLSHIPPLTLVTGLANGGLFALSVLHTLQGANTSFLGSGEVGLVAVGAAYRAVSEGDADWVLTGSYDDRVERWSYADFHRLGLLSRWEGEPAEAVRPFDRRRDGFALGEGAGMFVLEDLERARARGATVLAEIVGFCATSDASGMVSPRADGTALAAAISGAVQDAGMRPEQVDYVNGYASATLAGDRTELKALEMVFGEGKRPLVSAIKGAIGHLVAASGAVELGATALTLSRQLVPPTRNLEEPDPACQFDCVPGAAREAQVATALTLSRGIGGQNAAVVHHRGLGEIVHLPAGLPHPVAPVGVLVVEEEPLIQQTHLLQRAARRAQTSADHPVHRPRFGMIPIAHQVVTDHAPG
jgi:3-oxoacyl-[acyl-carrier-protein] synthase II